MKNKEFPKALNLPTAGTDANTTSTYCWLSTLVCLTLSRFYRATLSGILRYVCTDVDSIVSIYEI